MLLLRARTARCASRSLEICSRRSVRHLASTPQLHGKSAVSKSKLPSTPARTRFAPSPTGQLHLGSLRTALFNYLLARKTGGQFLLRLEDTDSKRTVTGAEQSLYADLRWAGLQWDEGPEVGGEYGPYRQSERTAIYREHAEQLVETNHAYRCFCTAERLDALARQRRELGMPTDYDRTCAHLSHEESSSRVNAGEGYVVRLRAPDTYPPFTDLVYGRIGGADTKGVTIKHGEVAYEDPILLKSDGSPTYHLANVVDDHLMRITHVVRATEWLPSTPKHLALYRAFGWDPPAYMHVGLLVDAEGRKLSKRTMSTGIGAIRDEMHVLAPALVNFAALLGWSHDRKSDVMQLEQLVEAFQAKFTRGNTTVSLEKLWFLQKAHAANIVKDVADSPPNEAAQRKLDTILDALTAQAENGDARPGLSSMTLEQPLREYLCAIFIHDARNYVSPSQFLARNQYFLTPIPVDANASAFKAGNLNQNDMNTLQRIWKAIRDPEHGLVSLATTNWMHGDLEKVMKDITQMLAEEDAKSDIGQPGTESLSGQQKAYYKLLCKYLRSALLNGNDGPGLGWTMEILGRAVCFDRLEAFGKHLAEAAGL